MYRAVISNRVGPCSGIVRTRQILHVSEKAWSTGCPEMVCQTNNFTVHMFQLKCLVTYYQIRIGEYLHWRMFGYPPRMYTFQTSAATNSYCIGERSVFISAKFFVRVFVSLGKIFCFCLRHYIHSRCLYGILRRVSVDLDRLAVSEGSECREELIQSTLAWTRFPGASEVYFFVDELELKEGR